MKTLLLTEFVAQSDGQDEAAKRLGCHQTAVSAALRNTRDIRIQLKGDEVVGAFEIKPAFDLGIAIDEADKSGLYQLMQKPKAPYVKKPRRPKG